MSEPIFIGGARERQFNNGGKIVSISFKQEDIDNMADYMNDAGYVNIDVKWGRNGKPYMQVNTYGLANVVAKEGRAEFAAPAPQEDDLPF